MNDRLEQFWRHKFAIITKAIWQPRYYGFEKIPSKGACLLIANHVSYVDGLIIAAGCNRPVRFVIDGKIYRLPIINYFMRLNRAIPILPNKESVTKALDAIAAGLADGDAICIFPEGQLTYTGSLSRFRPGVEWIVKRSPVPVYPIGIVGLWGSVFSRKYRKSCCRWFPRNIRLNIVAVCGSAIPPDKVKVNELQRIVLRLKHKASSMNIE